MSRAERIRDKYLAKGFSVEQPASEEFVARFESHHGIELPTAYREFVTKVSNGGIGPPAYGLVPLSLPKVAPGDLDQNEWESLPNVRKPFPFTKGWVWENDELSNEGSSTDVNCGSILLGTDGCGMDWHLIITGPDRGIPWMICGEGIQPVCPKRDFLDWVDDWLEGRDSFYGFEY